MKKEKSKKLPIHLNPGDQRNILFVSDLIDLAGTYGEIPKTLKFGITLTPHYIRLLDNLIPDLDPGNLDILFNSIKKLREKRRAENVSNPAFFV